MENLAELEVSPKTAFTEFNVLQEQGKPHFVRLHDSVVKRLEAQLGQHPCGLLLGSITAGEGCTIEVEEFEPAAQVEERVRTWRAEAGSRRQLVGYYRARSQSGFALDAVDQALFGRCFPKEQRLVLLVKPSKSGVGTAMFYLGEGGQLTADRATVEFPFNLHELGAEDSPAEPAPTPEAKQIVALQKATAPATGKAIAPAEQPASSPAKPAPMAQVIPAAAKANGLVAPATLAPAKAALVEQPASAPAAPVPQLIPATGAGAPATLSAKAAPVELSVSPPANSALAKPAPVPQPVPATGAGAPVTLSAKAAPVELSVLPPAKLAAPSVPAGTLAGPAAPVQPATPVPAKTAGRKQTSLLLKIAVAGVVVIVSGLGLSELKVFDRQTAQAHPNSVVVEKDAPAVPQQEIVPVSKVAEPAESAEPGPPKVASAKPAGVTSKTPSPALTSKTAPQPASPAPQPALVAQNTTPIPAPIESAVQTSSPAPLTEPPPLSRKDLATMQTAPPPVVVQIPNRVEPAAPSVPVTPPHALQRFAPELPSKALKSIVGEIVVRLKVNVDASGKVISTEPAPGSTAVDPAVIGAVASAVKRWKFEPARRGGENVAGDLIESFVFRK